MSNERETKEYNKKPGGYWPTWTRYQIEINWLIFAWLVLLSIKVLW